MYKAVYAAFPGFHLYCLLFIFSLLLLLLLLFCFVVFGLCISPWQCILGRTLNFLPLRIDFHYEATNVIATSIEIMFQFRAIVCVMCVDVDDSFFGRANVIIIFWTKLDSVPFLRFCNRKTKHSIVTVCSFHAYLRQTESSNTTRQKALTVELSVCLPDPCFDKSQFISISPRSFGFHLACTINYAPNFGQNVKYEESLTARMRV